MCRSERQDSISIQWNKYHAHLRFWLFLDLTMPLFVENPPDSIRGSETIERNNRGQTTIIYSVGYQYA